MSLSGAATKSCSVGPSQPSRFADSYYIRNINETYSGVGSLRRVNHSVVTYGGELFVFGGRSIQPSALTTAAASARATLSKRRNPPSGMGGGMAVTSSHSDRSFRSFEDVFAAEFDDLEAMGSGEGGGSSPSTSELASALVGEYVPGVWRYHQQRREWADYQVKVTKGLMLSMARQSKEIASPKKERSKLNTSDLKTISQTLCLAGVETVTSFFETRSGSSAIGGVGSSGPALSANGPLCESFLEVFSPPSARGDHSATIFGEFMFVFGGRRFQSTFDDLYAFNFKSRMWCKVKHEKELGPGPVFSHSAVSVFNQASATQTQRKQSTNAYLFVLGGVHVDSYALEGSREGKMLFVYDCSRNLWESFEGPPRVDPNSIHLVEMTFVSSGQSSAATSTKFGGGKLYVIGLDESDYRRTDVLSPAAAWGERPFGGTKQQADRSIGTQQTVTCFPDHDHPKSQKRSDQHLHVLDLATMMWRKILTQASPRSPIPFRIQEMRACFRYTGLLCSGGVHLETSRKWVFMLDTPPPIPATVLSSGTEIDEYYGAPEPQSSAEVLSPPRDPLLVDNPVQNISFASSRNLFGSADRTNGDNGNSYTSFSTSKRNVPESPRTIEKTDRPTWFSIHNYLTHTNKHHFIFPRGSTLSSVSHEQNRNSYGVRSATNTTFLASLPQCVAFTFCFETHEWSMSSVFDPVRNRVVDALVDTVAKRVAGDLALVRNPQCSNGKDENRAAETLQCLSAGDEGLMINSSSCVSCDEEADQIDVEALFHEMSLQDVLRESSTMALGASKCTLGDGQTTDSFLLPGMKSLQESMRAEIDEQNLGGAQRSRGVHLGRAANALAARGHVPTGFNGGISDSLKIFPESLKAAMKLINLAREPVSKNMGGQSNTRPTASSPSPPVPKRVVDGVHRRPSSFSPHPDTDSISKTAVSAVSKAMAAAAADCIAEEHYLGKPFSLGLFSKFERKYRLCSVPIFIKSLDWGSSSASQGSGPCETLKKSGMLTAGRFGGRDNRCKKEALLARSQALANQGLAMETMGSRYAVGRLRWWRALVVLISDVRSMYLSAGDSSESDGTESKITEMFSILEAELKSAELLRTQGISTLLKLGVPVSPPAIGLPSSQLAPHSLLFCFGGVVNYKDRVNAQLATSFDQINSCSLQGYECRVPSVDRTYFDSSRAPFYIQCTRKLDSRHKALEVSAMENNEARRYLGSDLLGRERIESSSKALSAPDPAVESVLSPNSKCTAARGKPRDGRASEASLLDPADVQCVSTSLKSGKRVDLNGVTKASADDDDDLVDPHIKRIMRAGRPAEVEVVAITQAMRIGSGGRSPIDSLRSPALSSLPIKEKEESSSLAGDRRDGDHLKTTLRKSMGIGAIAQQIGEVLMSTRNSQLRETSLQPSSPEKPLFQSFRRPQPPIALTTSLNVLGTPRLQELISDALLTSGSHSHGGDEGTARGNMFDNSQRGVVAPQNHFKALGSPTIVPRQRPFVPFVVAPPNASSVYSSPRTVSGSHLSRSAHKTNKAAKEITNPQEALNWAHNVYECERRWLIEADTRTTVQLGSRQETNGRVEDPIPPARERKTRERHRAPLSKISSTHQSKGEKGESLDANLGNPLGLWSLM